MFLLICTTCWPITARKMKISKTEPIESLDHWLRRWGTSACNWTPRNSGVWSKCMTSAYLTLPYHDSIQGLIIVLSVSNCERLWINPGGIHSTEQKWSKFQWCFIQMFVLRWCLLQGPVICQSPAQHINGPFTYWRRGWARFGPDYWDE